jgi:hypothetical protein
MVPAETVSHFEYLSHRPASDDYEAHGKRNLRASRVFVACPGLTSRFQPTGSGVDPISHQRVRLPHVRLVNLC